MKAITTIIITSLVFSLANSQNIDFTLSSPQPNLIDSYSGSFASGDIDGDGDQDLLIAGQNPGANTALYFNDGNGNFTEDQNNPFPEARNSVSIFEDLDMDGDLDLFFSGNSPSVGTFAHIYLNNGTGIFTQLPNPAIPQFVDGGAVIGDVDNDGDLDILISTLDSTNNFIADVYLNNGTAVFTAMGSTVFTAVKFSSLKCIDVENDGDLDVIIAGELPNGNASTALYINDGVGNFSVDNGSIFEQIKADDIDIADTDNDGDFDILMSGLDDNTDAKTILYINDGNGQFSELSSTGLQQTFAGSNEIADLDNDGDQDLILMGSQDGGLPNIFTIVYENIGNNQFIESDTIGGEYLAASIVDDFNGDGLIDVVIQGFIGKTNVYWNATQILSSEDFQSNFLISIYPNPSNGNFILKTGENKELNLRVFDINGKLVYRQESLLELNNINLNLSNGLYLISLTSKNISQTEKLIISK